MSFQAQFLYAEMAMVGKHCTKLQGETAGACVTLEDIPPNVVKLINDTMRRIDVSHLVVGVTDLVCVSIQYMHLESSRHQLQRCLDFPQ